MSAKINKLEDIKKVKLDPIDQSGVNNNNPSKANRLLALSKSNQGGPLLNMNNRLNRNDSKLGNKLPKAKNF